MKPLTRRQFDTLAAIREFVSVNGVAPTLGELCETLGTSSQGSMTKHLRALQDRGLIENGSGSRQIVLKDLCPYCGR